MNENLCKQCGKYLPVHNGKCERCLDGRELEAYADKLAQDEELSFAIDGGRAARSC